MNKPLKYIPGGNWAVCDRCGFVYRAKDLKKEWTGAMVCEDDWEPRHPQEMIKGRKEKTAAAVVNSEPTEQTTDVSFSEVEGNTIPDGTFGNYLD